MEKLSDESLRLTRIQQDLRRTVAPLPRDAPDVALVIENDEILQAIEESARGSIRHPLPPLRLGR